MCHPSNSQNCGHPTLGSCKAQLGALSFPSREDPGGQDYQPLGRTNSKNGGAAWSQGALSLPPQQSPLYQQAVSSLSASWLELRPAAHSGLLSRAGTSATTRPGKWLRREGATALPEQWGVLERKPARPSTWASHFPSALDGCQHPKDATTVVTTTTRTKAWSSSNGGLAPCKQGSIDGLGSGAIWFNSK